MKNILVLLPVLERHKAYLEQIGSGCSICYCAPNTVTQEQIDEADVIIGNAAPGMIAHSQRLQWLQLNSAGADAYCKPGIIRPGTILTNATGAYGLSVSEWMVAATMMLCRKMDLYAANQAAHRWQCEGTVSSVWGSTTLVLGLGDIGSAYAAVMKAMGSHVIGLRRDTRRKPDCVDELYHMEQLDEVLPRADFVAMVLPSTPETHHIMNESRLLHMKPGAFLINAGRGDAVDCDALARILNAGAPLAGAALDVTEPEPLPENHPLWDAPRCILTPHIAGGFHLPETLERIIRIAGENLSAFLAGEFDSVRNQIDPSTGSRK